MNEDIGAILKGWKFKPGELGVRKITGLDGKDKIQIRMDLGLMQYVLGYAGALAAGPIGEFVFRRGRYKKYYE